MHSVLVSDLLIYHVTEHCFPGDTHLAARTLFLHLCDFRRSLHQSPPMHPGNNTMPQPPQLPSAGYGPLTHAARHHYQAQQPYPNPPAPATDTPPMTGTPAPAFPLEPLPPPAPHISIKYSATQHLYISQHLDRQTSSTDKHYFAQYSQPHGPANII